MPFLRRRTRSTSRSGGVFEATRRARALVAAGVALILVSPFISVVPGAAAADLVPVVIDLSKTTSAPTDGTAVANESVSYDFTITCSSTQSDCVNLVLTDSFPEPIVFDSVNTNSNYTIGSAPNGFTLTFTNPLDEGGVGLVAGETVSFQAIGHVRGDVDASFDGQTVINTAYATVDNPDSNNQSSAPVAIIAPLVVSSTISKTVTPNTMTGFQGLPVAFALSATNTSNATVDVMRISDPAEAVLPTNAYEYLTVTSLSNVVFPSGANRVQVDYYNGTQWVNGTPAATAVLPSGTIKGLRFTFTNSDPAVDIVRGATGSVTINTVTNADVPSLTTPFSGLNIASSQVERGTTLGTIVQANGPFTINPAAIRPQATKVFSSHDVVGGENLTATLGAQNAGDFTLSELAIVEPYPGSTSFADQGFEFVAINQGQVEWPTGATAVDVTYVYEDGIPASAVTGSTVDTLPTPEAGRTVIGFTANFKGTMAPGAYATVPFSIHTLPTVTDLSTTNTIRVDARTTSGLTASTSALDTLVRRSVRINTTITKNIDQSTLFAPNAAPIMISLQSFIDARPTSPTDTGGSTIGATRFEITDDDADFWDVFNPSNIVATEIPSGSTLQILYSTDNGNTYPGTQVILAATNGPASVNVPIPSALQPTISGIKFVYTPTVPGTLLQPGFNVQPNLQMRLRATERASGDPIFAVGSVIQRAEDNTASTFVENSNAGVFGSDDDNDVVAIEPPDPSGGPGYDLLEKAWIDDQVVARSSANATAVLSWGTGGQEYQSVVISDHPDDSSTSTGDPSMASVPATVYDSFDLARIEPITSSTDPLIVYDSISAVEYFSRTTNAWEPLNDNGNPCSLGCNGGFPGYTLSTAERADAIGVRLIVVERPGRPAPTTATAPLVGSGVAATTTLNRHISLTFQLRTVLRSNTAVAVLGSTRGQLYNTGSAGLVSNVAGIEGRDATNAILWDETANDEILIIDQSLNVIATKTWVDGPLGVPPVGTAQSLFPIGLMTVTAQNATVFPVNELKLEEPTGGTTPFQHVNIVQIDKLSGSTDTTSVAVLAYENGTFSAPIPINTLVTMTATQFQDVVGLTLTKSGRIVPSETIGLQIHTQLREFVRGTSTRTAPMTVTNQTTASVTDPGGTTTPSPSTAPNNVVTDIATASIDIESWSYGVVANKSISTSTVEYGANSSTSTTGRSASTDGLTPEEHGTPQTAAIQYDNGEAINRRATVTVSGQPTGNVRTTDLVLEDTSPTFWNVYNFVSLDATPLADSRKRVRVDVLLGYGSGWGFGVNYDTTSGITSTCTGDGSHPDCWVIGTASATPTMPAMPGGSQVADIRGLRFTYTNADGSSWERPHNPPMTAQFTVDRRTLLVSPSATPVPSTMFTYTSPSPGETTQGVFTNTVVATAAARTAAGSPALWSATADATAQIRYQHLPARVMIKKSPVGAQSLNTDIPYKIVVTNTGGTLDRQLGNVIVTDALPVNTTVMPPVTMLVVPNDADGVAQDVTAVTTVRVASSTNATLPTPAFTATLQAASGSTQNIVFDFDDAWVLPRLATLTITVNLQFPPQLEAGTLVTNTATVTADRPFDTCQWYVDNGTVAETPRNQVNDCYSRTTVYPLASAPVTIVKGVRGVGAGPLDTAGNPIDSDTVTPGVQPYDDLGILKTVPGSSVNCNTPNVATGIVAEYYRYPCVPITRPGGTEEWASTFTNGGNIGLTKIVAIDVLPAPSDRGVIVNEARGSKWTPILTTYPTFVNLPAGATYDIYYVTNRAIASQRCNGADIQNSLGMVPGGTPIPMTAGYTTCVTNSAPIDSVASRNAAWQLLSPTADATTLASVVAMKFVITMQNGSPLAPGSKMSIVYQSRTAASVELAETGAAIDNQSVAYNSIAAAAAGYDTSTSTTVPNRFVTEPRKVGVAMATGTIEIRKAVTGAAAARSQASFNITATCTSAGVSIPVRAVAVPKDTTVIVHGLPLYASCVIAEASGYNQNPESSSITPGTVTAQAPATAGLEAIFDPNPVFGAGRPTIERSTVTNDYPTTTFTITKTLNINGAVDRVSGGSPVYPSDLRFSAVCTFNNGATSPEVLNVTGINLSPAGGTATYTSPSIPVGSSCTVTETSTRAAQSTTYVVTVGGVAGTSTTGTAATFTVDDTGNSVAFTNNYGVGSLTLNKVIAGAWATAAATPAHTTGTFTVNVRCTRQLNSTTPVEVTFDDNVTFSAATVLTRTISNIAQGSSCTISETGTGGATTVAITSGSTVTINGGNQTRTITNTFSNASLSVTKTVHTDAVDGSGDVVYLDAPYTVNVSCTFQGNSVYATGYTASPMELTFSAAELGNTKTATKTLSGLPAGASCSVAESPTPANASSVRVDWNTASTSGSSSSTTAVVGPLTADGTAPVVTNRATVNNYYGVGHFTVTKSLRGDAATAFGLGPFTVHIVCVSGTTTTYDGTVSLTPTALTATIDNLATGSVCSAEETTAGRSAPDAIVYIDAFDDTTDGAGVDAMATNPLVTIENWYLTGSVVVTKSVIETAGYGFGAGPFEIELSCVRGLTGPAANVTTTVTRTMDPATPASMTQTFTDLPSGALCTLRETDDGGASSTTITNGTSTSTVAGTGISFTVAVDSTIHSSLDQVQPAISVTNNFTQAALDITKSIDSDALDANGDPLGYGPFPVSVVCEFNGGAVYGDGYSSTAPMTHDLVAGTPWRITGLPSGADCDVTETDVMDAVSTTVTTVEASGTSSTTSFSQSPVASVPTTSLVLGPLSTTNSVAFTNFYEEGSLELSKQILGAAATTWGDTEFTVNVTCTLTDASAPRADVFDEDYTFSNALGLGPVLIEHLPAGADCVITETDDGTATATEIDVTTPVGATTSTTGTAVTVTITNETDPTEVAVKNTFEYTSIEVIKERTGAGAGLYDQGPFEVTLSCTFEGSSLVDSDVPGGLVRELTLGNSYYTEYTDLPVGADCDIEETETGSATSTSIRLGALTPATAGTALSLTTTAARSDVYVTNDYEVGSLDVTKTTTGAGSFLYGDGSAIYGSVGFEVALACTQPFNGGTANVVLPYAANVTLDGGNGYAHTFDDLPVGALCEITETRAGFASSTTVGAPVVITAAGVGTQSIDVVNDFELGSFRLSKATLGLFADRRAANSFQISVECWQDVNGVPTKIDPIANGDTRVIKAGETTDFIELPVPAECTFSELDNGGADMGIYSRGSVPMIGSTLTVEPADVDIDLANMYVLAHSGSDADVWIIGALISLLAGVALVVVGRRREKAIRAS
jgi:large repetitive protein